MYKKDRSALFLEIPLFKSSDELKEKFQLQK